MLSWIGRSWFWLTGWKVGDWPPDLDKFVLIASPHTSYWDFPFTMAYGWMCKLDFNWFGKHQMFTFPWGPLFRRMGGISVDRRSPQGLVEQMVDAFVTREQLRLVVPPKGTRAKREYCKSGFYAIAYAAGVPVVPGYLDFKNKRAGIGPPIELTGDVAADMDRFRAFYAGIEGKRPELQSPLRLRAEDDEEARARLLGVVKKASLRPRPTKG